MSDFTIEQLEALREGITKDRHPDMKAWKHTGNGYINLPTGYEGEFINWNDADLMAAAPDLLDALSAEKRKNDDLRQEIGSLIGKLETRAENAESNRAYALAVAFRESERDLARILEADNG